MSMPEPPCGAAPARAPAPVPGMPVGVVPPGLWGHVDSLPYSPTNVNQAKTLLKQAGYGPGGKKMTLLPTHVQGDSDEELVSALIKSNLAPLNIDVRYRPTQHTFADFRSDIDTRGGGLRAMSATLGMNRSLIQAFSSFYYTRAVELVPSLSAFADARGKEAGTLRGSQWSPSVFLGNREKGLFGGVSLFFDFQKHPFAANRSLISSTTTIGYTWKCCAITAQDFTFNVGLRNENRLVFAFRLNGIGTFGTEKIGQWSKQ